MFLSNTSIARRLTIVLGLILLLSLASSLFAIAKLRELSADVATMTGVNVKVEQAANDWLRFTTAGVQRASAIAKSSDPSLAQYFAAASAESIKQTTVLQKFIESKMVTPDERALLEKVAALRKTYLAARDDVSRLKLAGDSAGAEKAFTEHFEPVAKEYVAAVQSMTDYQRGQVDAMTRATSERRDQTTAMLIASSCVSIGIGALLAWLLARSITVPLKRAQTMALAISRMDLTSHPRAVYASDETGQLLRAIETMRSALAGSLHQIRGVAESISTASTQIAIGNQDLSARTEQTASSLQQTASSMEELTGTVRQSADSAAQANQMASSAAEVARRGGTAVSQVTVTMEDINGSSRRIADIIGVIDGIAFQTNILALNAAVEAARAGEQGRGFAVVASEVRSLAQRSAEAAKEIKGLIGQSVDKVELGSRLVGDAGATMNEIVASVQRVTDIIGEISAAASEQSSGIGQIGVAVNQLDQMTQQNAALVEESAAAAESLKEQAKTLSNVIATFRLDSAQA
jgi:methyl-accepting chemotaxis protein